jgi:signal transduction histidine kinase
LFSFIITIIIILILIIMIITIIITIIITTTNHYQVFMLCDQYTDETRTQLAAELEVGKLADKYDPCSTRCSTFIFMQIHQFAHGVCQQDNANRFQLFVTLDSTLCRVVRAQMMHMLGVLAETFPLEIAGKDGTILNIFMANLKTEVCRLCA